MKVNPPFDSLSFISQAISIIFLCMMVGLLSAIYLNWKGLVDIRLIAAVSCGCAGLLITFSYGRLAGIIRLGLCSLAIGVLLCCQAADIMQDNRIFFGLPPEKITTISGRLTADSNLSMQENQVLTIALISCAAQDGTTADAHGILLAIGGSHDLLLCGAKLSLLGSVIKTEDAKFLFLTDSAEVIIISPTFQREYLSVRKRILEGLLQKFEALGKGPAELSGLLLFGRTEEAGSSIKQLSVESGCAHILALSGMHLQFFAGLSASILALFLGKRRGKILSIPLVALFLCIAGPKPSLIRAAFMYFAALDSQKRCLPKSALLIACAAQLYLFPQTVASLGCLLSYSSLAGLMILQPPVWSALQRVVPRRLAMILAASTGALLFSGPCALMVFGRWHPIGIVIAPLAGPLAFLYMGLSMLWLIVPIPAIAYCIQQTHALFLSLLEVGAGWSLTHPTLGSAISLLVYLSALLTVVGFLLYAGQTERIRSAHHHEMGLSLRFPECNHRVIG